jgi:hypothetical protein
MKNKNLRYLAALAVLGGILAWHFISPSDSPRGTSPETVGVPTALAPSPAPDRAADTRADTGLSSHFPAAPAWRLPENISGTKLIPDSTAVTTARLQGRAIEGRSAMIAQSSFVEVEKLQPGQRVEFPLFDGRTVVGTVNTVQADDTTHLRAGGRLESGAGTFYLSSDGKENVASLLLPGDKLAYELETQKDGTSLLRERLLSDVVCFPIPREPNRPTAARAVSRAALEAPPLLSSRPSAVAVLYLDFDGEIVTDPRWNGGQTINAAPSALTNTQITDAWRRVKEDFAPFDIDVTTDPARYANAPVGRRMRCIITPTDDAAPGFGGVAYLRSFARAGTGSFTSTIPCWVFNETVEGVVEASSHEIGHTFGLNHDGRTSPEEEYYNGHGTGAVSWGPIMGAAYGRTLTQWSKGEYAAANNPEDDIAVISGTTNGFGFIPDEAGNTTASAATLSAPGGTVDQSGVVLNQTDADYFSFSTTSGGAVSLTAAPAPQKPNLDIILSLHTADGSVLAQANPDTATNATLTATVPAGTFYVKVQGTGRGDPLGTGYTAYGSIGQYRITGTVPGNSTVQPPVIGGASTASGTVNTPFSYQIVASNNPTSYGITGALPAGLALNTTTGLISGTPGASGTFPVTLSATNAAGTGSAAFTVTITEGGGLTLASALDGTGLVWTTGGTANWAPQTTTTSDGVDAAASGDIADNQNSYVQTTVTGPATVTFRWKVSSEGYYDRLRFIVNGTTVRHISGERAWATVTYTLPNAATYTLRWHYVKDYSISAGADTGWLDQVSITR